MTAPMQTRAGGEKRGNNRDRAARKVWMLFQFGNGEYVGCVHCKTVLTYDTVEADRIVPGGTYARHNVQPACRKCNLARSNDLSWTAPSTRTTTSDSAARAIIAFAAAWETDLSHASLTAFDHLAWS